MRLNIGEEASEGEVEEGNKDKGKEKHALSSWSSVLEAGSLQGCVLVFFL